MKNAEKNFDKLRKRRVLPSILSFILSLFLALLATIASMMFIISYFSQERMDVAYNNARQLAQHLKESENQERSLTTLSLNREQFEAVLLMDGDESLGYGENTIEASSFIEYNSDGTLLYTDRSNPYHLFDEEGTIQLDTLVIEQLRRIRFDRLFQTDKHAILYSLPLWFRLPLSPTQTMLAKFNLYLYQGDFILALCIGGFFLMALVLPTIFTFTNVISNIFSQRRMTKLLYIDPATLGNSWFYFETQAQKTLSRQRRDRCYAIVDLCIMKYRSYCISHGVKAGDKLLAEVSEELASLLQRRECYGHYGLSRFALLIEYHAEDGCQARLQSILDSLTAIPELDTIPFHMGVCEIASSHTRKEKVSPIPVKEYHNRACTARECLDNETQSDIFFFDQNLLDEQLWEHKVLERMQEAVDNEEFLVYIQPKYNPVTGALSGGEALVRWNSPDSGFLSPGRFVPIIERNGLITKLDDYMISHVAKLQSEWLAEGKKVVPISVNVSRAHFANPHLAQHICSLVDKYELPHSLLEIELTESAFFDDRNALLNTVRELQELDFEVSMDDFGSGYSSLNSLKDLPLNVLKLDAGFFHGDDEGKRGEIVVSEAIRLAKQLNMQIVAEGIEKQSQVDFLASNGCDMIQGYFYAKPMPAAEYAKTIDA